MSEEIEGPFAIHRLGKVKRNALGLTHAARSENKVQPTHLIRENPPPQVLLNAAPRGMNFVDFVIQKYDQAKAQGRVYRPRKDQVLALEGVLTASPEFFRPSAPNVAGQYEIEKVQQIRDRAIPYLKKLYGENLVRVELQVDEVTPHFQYAILPIDPSGRWSAKNCMSRSALRNLWDSWYDATKDLGLKRGNPEMIGDHIPVRQFYFAAGVFKKYKNDAERKLRLPHYRVEVPSRTSLLSPQKLADDTSARLAIWLDEQSRLLQKRLAPLFAAVAEQRLKNRRATQYRASALKLEKENRELEKQIEEIKEKAQKSEPVSIQDVARRLGTSVIPKELRNEESVVFLRKLENLSEDEAFGWIISEFGVDRAAATAADLTRSKFIGRASTLPKLNTRSFEKIRNDVVAQLSALRADSFQVLYKSQIGKSAQMMPLAKPKTKSMNWALEDVLTNLPIIRTLAENNVIQILPVSSNYDYLCVEGAKSKKELAELNFDPCVILQVRPRKFEAVLRCPIESADAQIRSGINEYAATNGLAIFAVDRSAAIPLVGFRVGSLDKAVENGSELAMRVDLVSAVDVDAFSTSVFSNRLKHET